MKSSDTLIAIGLVIAIILEAIDAALGFPVPGLSVLIGAAVAYLFADFVQVPEDERWVVERFKKFSHVKKPGLGVLVRFVERVRKSGTGKPGGRRSTREYIHPFQVTGTITKKGTIFERIDGVVRTRMKNQWEDPNAVFKNAYVPDRSISLAIDALADNVIRTIVGEYDFDDIWDNRHVIEPEIVERITPTLDRWGEKFLQIDISEVVPAQHIREAMEKPFLAEQQAKAAEHEGKADALRAEGERDAEIHRAEGAAKAVRLASEAERDKEINEAQARKVAMDLEAQSKEEALEKLGAPFGYKKDGTPASNRRALNDARNYMLAEERLKTISDLGGKMIIVPAGTEGLASIMAMIDGVMNGAKEKPTTPKAP